MLSRKTSLLFALTIISSYYLPTAFAQNNGNSVLTSTGNAAKSVASKATNAASTAATSATSTATTTAKDALKAALAKMTPEQRALYWAAVRAKKEAKQAATQAASRASQGNPWGPYDPYNYQPKWAIQIDNQDIPQGVGLPLTRLGGDGMGGS